MIRTKDHKTRNMFDPLDHLGPKRRKLLEQSWASLFRREILPNLPVDRVLPFYSSENGAPTKELYSMQGLMLLQQTFDLTDKEAVKQFAFNFEWHYALDIGDDSDQSTYVSEKTLWNMRHLLTENDLYQALFDIPTRQIAGGSFKATAGFGAYLFQHAPPRPDRFVCPDHQEIPAKPQAPVPRTIRIRQAREKLEGSLLEQGGRLRFFHG